MLLRRQLALVLLAVLSLRCVPAAQAQSCFRADTDKTNAIRLAQIADEFWQYALKSRLYQGAISGEQLTDLPDISEQKENAVAAFALHIAEELKAVNPKGLNHQDWLTLQILTWEMWRISEEAKHYWLFFQITPYTSPLPLAQSVLAGHPMRNRADL